MIAVSNTTPIHYLVLIRLIDLLPQFFRQVIIPPAVSAELNDSGAPSAVRTWLASRPAWLNVQHLQRDSDSSLDYLDNGEREAICLAQAVHADMLLLDDGDARRAAGLRNLPFIGTLGILRKAAQLDLIDLQSTLANLQATTFYIDSKLIQLLLDEDAERRRG
jgi:predicted nucleic acid-binding protein